MKSSAIVGAVALLGGVWVLPVPAAQFALYWTGPPGEALLGPAGDVDGDGNADVVLAAGLNPSPSAPVEAVVRSGLNQAILRTWTPSLPGYWAFAGNLQHPAGDLNLDGFGDVALGIGIPNSIPSTTAIEVRSGSDGSVLGIIPPPPASNATLIGYAIAGGGDLDGDGWPELLTSGNHQVSVPGCLSYGQGVYNLEAPGFGLQYFTTSFQCSQEFGWQLGRLDDVDGDGFDDFYVGASGTYVAGVGFDAGWIGVFSGVSGVLIASVNGTAQTESLGVSIAGLGDVTGDGLPEIAVRRGGTVNQLAVLSLPSFSTVYSSSAASIAGPGGAILGVDGLGDADGDGLQDYLVHWRTAQFSDGITAYSGPTGSPIGTVSQGLPGSILYPWGALGDVNGDGLGDFGASPLIASIYAGNVAVQSLWTNWTWPMTDGAVRVYVAPNLKLVGPTSIGGTAQFQVIAPKHAGRPFQVVFSRDIASPPLALGPFPFPLLPDGLFWASYVAGLGGPLNGSGQGTVTVPIPNDPSLRGAGVLASGVVYDSSSPIGIGCVLTQVGFTIQ